MTMYRVGPRVSRAARWAAGFCLVASSIAVLAPEAEARSYRYHHAYRHFSRPRAAASEANFASIVVDANTGREIYGVNENALRHPASITKVMTLYLLFEQLDKGTLTLQSR